MHAYSASRGIFCFWIVLLASAVLAAPSPVAEPEPAPIGPNIAEVISSNRNLACQNGCPAAGSVQQLNTNAALGSTATPLSLLGGLALAGGLLASL